MKLSNPYYQEARQEVRVREGETQALEVTLQPLHEGLGEPGTQEEAP